MLSNRSFIDLSFALMSLKPGRLTVPYVFLLLSSFCIDVLASSNSFPMLFIFSSARSISFCNFFKEPSNSFLNSSMSLFKSLFSFSIVITFFLILLLCSSESETLCARFFNFSSRMAILSCIF